MRRGDAALTVLRAIAGSDRRVLWTLLIVWLASVGGGLGWLMAYDNTPGAPAHAPSLWPGGSGLARDESGPTVVMLAHPRCDCTRASLGELAELLARARRPPRTFVLFLKPGGVAPGWEKTGTFVQAGRIPGVTVVRDDDAAEAKRFGVETSGQVLLYDAGGRLVYAGGITAARGKTGSNDGRTALLEWIDGGHSALSTARVFGCSLFSWLKGEPKSQGAGGGS